MFARVSWTQVPTDRIEELAANSPQRLSALNSLPGFLGTTLLMNRESGAGMSVTYWQSAETMQASEEAGASIRAQAAKDGVQIGEIDRFELLVQERIAPPRADTVVRVNDLPGSPSKADDLAKLTREATPTLKSIPGFRAVLMGANR